MVNEKDYKRLLEKVEKVTKQKELDLSSDEDLSIGIMNLISVEEHLFFTAEKTGKYQYYELLKEIREMRKELLKKIIKDYEGEIWCISKHLLSTSMRLMEVGTKQLGRGNNKEAQDLFKKAYQLYSLFWAINLKVIDMDDLQKSNIISKEQIDKFRDESKTEEIKIDSTESSFLQKVGNAFKKAIDCCKE